MTNFNHTTVDGNLIDLSAGVTTNQILGYNGTKVTAIANQATAIYWNPLVEANYTAGASGAGNYTMGCAFVLCCPATVTGCQFVFPDAVSRTIRFRCWLASVAQIVNAGSATYYEQTYSTPGTYTVTFPVPVAITVPSPIIKVSYWHTAGTRYYQYVPPSAKRPPNTTYNQSGPNFAWYDTSIYAAGDAMPSFANAPSAASVIVPIFTIP